MIFSFLRFPVADLLGALTAIILFKIFITPLPAAPDFFSPLIQICLGLYIGSKVSREKVLSIKELIKPALIIICWVLAMAFIAGYLLFRITGNNITLITGILSSTLGGLPEMTIIAMETNADASVVIVIKTLRMILTVIILPVIIEKRFSGSTTAQQNPDKKAGKASPVPFYKRAFKIPDWPKPEDFLHQVKSCNLENLNKNILSIKYGLLSLSIAAVGGLLFRYLHVPAGAMVGGMIFIVTASMVGIKIITVPLSIITLLRVGLGVVIADNINIDTFAVFTSGTFILAAAVNTVVVFASFFIVAYIFHRVTGWDYQTCFLSASPAGFTVMTTLAAKYEKDISTISILHLCRLITIKTVFPFLFMYFV